MRYWWVNQNQTYRHEVGGGYLWSPKRSRNGHHNPFYESMREIAPGDIIFSFFDTRIAAIGIAQSYCYESPKPDEFGRAGLNWSAIGWKVGVQFLELANRIRPKDHMSDLARLLPQKYSPLRPDGNGLQSVYLTEIGLEFAESLFRLIGTEASTAKDVAKASIKPAALNAPPESTIDEWEARVESEILRATTLKETEKSTLIQARRGQGLFRANVFQVERLCRVTKVDRPEHLVASHSKPWRDSSNDERLDGENGLLLTPSIDHLFDRGFISFENSGRLLVSPVAHRDSLSRMGISVDQSINVGPFSQGQRRFLDYHRDNVFRMAQKRT